MKKTMLTVAAVCMLMATGVQAEQKMKGTDSKIANVSKTVDISSFCKAIMQGDIDMVQRLIDLGENVNQKSLGMTPSIFAARYNKAEILELLIENGADLTIKCNKGFTVKKHAELSNAIDALAIIESAMGN